MHRSFILYFPIFIVLFIGCNALKYVPEDKCLLEKVNIISQKGTLDNNDLKIYINQTPNESFFGLFHLNLFFYNLSGKDTTRFVNRMLRKMGEAPVLYDSIQTDRSCESMQSVFMNNGYYDATVIKKVKIKKRRAYVTYLANGNKPYTVRNYSYIPIKDSLSLLIENEMKNSIIHSGMLLSSGKLDEERNRLTRLLQREGYYSIQKDYFSFNIDSTLSTHQADVELVVKPYIPDTTGLDLSNDSLSDSNHPVYKINHIYFMLDVPMSSFTRNPVSGSAVNSANKVFDIADYDTIVNNSYRIIYKGKPFVSAKTLIENCRIVPGELYDISMVEKTYTRMNSLQLLKYINIRFVENETDSVAGHQLDCYIVLTPNLKQAMSTELEGTNTAGDLGVAGNINYTHRNFFNGGELFQAKIRGDYEALSTNKYTELGGELGLTFPEFMMPFLKSDFKRKVDATTQFTMSYEKMTRPEFVRNIASASVRYNWNHKNIQQTFNLIDLSYVYMPWVSAAFKTTYLTDSSYLKYSYEDQFILRMVYSFSYSSVPFGSANRTHYTFRGSVESAGNLLDAVYALSNANKEDGFYKIGNVNFAQYLKGEAEYAKIVYLNSGNSIAYRFGLGLAYPYGNSNILPFEKRFFSGGANSVRGWSVRALGPGSYKGSTTINFMNQSGDMKLDLGAEYRNLLFWKLESALFIDAGNIWTLRDYTDQPGGQFKFDTFYEQIASSVGAGLRLNFEYFLLRLDLGMKVYDPSLTGDARWRIKNIHSTDDFALHFAIGYPF